MYVTSVLAHALSDAFELALVPDSALHLDAPENGLDRLEYTALFIGSLGSKLDERQVAKRLGHSRPFLQTE